MIFKQLDKLYKQLLQFQIIFFAISVQNHRNSQPFFNKNLGVPCARKGGEHVGLSAISVIARKEAIFTRIASFLAMTGCRDHP